MKRVIIAAILLAAVLGLSIFSHFSLMNACDSLTAALTDVRTAARNGDENELKILTEKALIQWQKEKTLFHILIHHNLMTELETSMKKAEYYTAAGEIEEVYAEAENCIENISHIKESSTPSISNIF